MKPIILMKIDMVHMLFSALNFHLFKWCLILIIYQTWHHFRIIPIFVKKEISLIFIYRILVFIIDGLYNIHNLIIVKVCFELILNSWYCVRYKMLNSDFIKPAKILIPEIDSRLRRVIFVFFLSVIFLASL